MSEHYRAISWNPQKRRYDTVLFVSLCFYLLLFVVVSLWVNPNATLETLLIRAFGSLAFLLLHVTLMIGPLSRLQPRFLPLLYNRRHLGVTTFLVGLVHGVFSIIQFHALGDLNPLISVLVSNRRVDSLAQFPFQVLGLLALLILFLMAATSHDFWLKLLTAPLWKGLHMLVYAAYALLIAHVSLGALQSDTSSLLPAVLAVGIVSVVSVHVLAAIRERRCDQQKATLLADGFAEVCRLGEIPEKRARIISHKGERIAVFKYDGKLAALSNACQHQNGPLGEGRIIDGCVTCPWHGFQYVTETGASPPPFTEQVATYQVKVVESVVYVHPTPLLPKAVIGAKEPQE